MDKGVLWKTVSELFGVGLKGFQLDYLADLLSGDKRRLVAVWCRQTGKSMCTGIACVLRCLQRPDSTVLVVAPTERQSKKLAKDFCLGFAERCPVVKSEIVRVAEPEIVFRNGSRIVYLPLGDDGRTVRGITADWVVCDEAAFVQNDKEVFNGVLFPMIATRPKGKIVLLSTPNGKGENFFWKCFCSSDFVVHHYDFRVGVECGLISGEFIDFQRRNSDSLLFRREYEAEFIDDSTSYFGGELVSSCVQDYALFSEDEVLSGSAGWSGRVFAGLDPARFGSDRQVLLLAESGVGGLRVRFVKFWDKSSVDETLDYLSLLFERVPRFARLVVDETGLGGFSDLLVRRYNHYSDKTFDAHSSREKQHDLDKVWQVTFTQRKKEELYSKCKVMMSNKEVVLPRHDLLVRELSVVEFEITQSGLKIRAPSGCHDDFADALVCLCYGSERRSETAWFWG